MSNATDVTILDADLARQTIGTIDKLLAVFGALGDAAWTGTGNATLIALEKATALNQLSGTPSPVVGPGSHKEIAASTGPATCGTTGAVGDYLSHVTIIPATTSPGSVTIQDAGGSAITIFTGGASSVTNLVPFGVPLGLNAATGPWKVTTGANVSAIAVGKFT